MGLAKQITENAIFRGIFLVFQLLNTVVISRLTGPAGFGIYSLLIVNGSFLLMLTSLGIPSGILYHASTKDMPMARLIRIAWWSTWIQLLVIIPGEFIFRAWRGEFFIWKDEYLAAGIAGFIYFFSIVLTEKYYALYNGSGQLATYNKITAFFNFLLFVILSVPVVTSYHITLEWVISIFIAVQFTQFIFLVIRFRKHDMPVAIGHSSRGMITYSLMAYGANLVYFLLTRVDFWILEYYRGEAELGIYALAVRIVQLLLILPALLSSVILPSVAGKTLGKASMEIILRLLNTLNLIIVIALLLTSTWLIPLVFGGSFEGSGPVLIMLLPGILFLSAQTFLASYFAGKGQVLVNVYSAMIALIFAIVLDLLLIPKMGSMGAAIASSVSYLVCFMYSFVRYTRDEGYPWYALLIRNSDLQWLKKYLFSNNGIGS